MKKEIIMLEGFSGIGGFFKGFEEAGYTIKKHYFSEVDKHAIANYKYNFKNAESIGSITDVRGNGIERPDIFTFGSPCQDFSLAGKRSGMEGQRSVLILEAIRIIKECKPSVFIWENVKGAFSSNSSADFWAILSAFANIGGYRLEWQLLNTSWFLPQNRERIYLVGHLVGASELGIFPIGNSNELHNKRKCQESGIIASTLNANDNKSWVGNFVIPANTKKGFETVTESDSINFSVPNSKTRRGRVGVGVAQTLDTQCNIGVVDKTNIRRLTEIECERLQGFPDDWTKYGVYSDKNGVEFTKEIPKTQRYKMCGNAVTVAVVKEIASRIKLTI